MTDGGEGSSGWVPSDETKRKIGEKAKGRKTSDKTKDKLREIGRKAHLEGNRENLLNAGRLHNETRIGKTYEEIFGEERAKEIKEKMRGVKGHGENISKAQKGVKCPKRGHKGRNKGKTLEEIYGEEKAKEIKHKQSLARKRYLANDKEG